MQTNHAPEESSGRRTKTFGSCRLGGLAESAQVFRADNGTSISLKKLLDSGERPPVWSLDERMRFVPRMIEKISRSGRAKVVRLHVASGRSLEMAADSQLLTVSGWRPAEALGVNDRVAIPRWIPQPVSAIEMPDPEVILLAHMIGDGSCVKRQPIRYASIDEENLAAVTAAASHFGITAVRDDYAAARVTTLRLPAPYRLARGKRNPVAAWLDELGLFGLRSYDKFVPAPVFAMPTELIAIFLRHPWATDGSVRWNARGRQARIYYASTSHRLIDDVNDLLLRLGVHGRIKRVPEGRIPRLLAPPGRRRREPDNLLRGHRSPWRTRQVSGGCSDRTRHDDVQHQRRHDSQGDLGYRASASSGTQYDSSGIPSGDGDQVLRVHHVEARTKPAAPRSCGGDPGCTRAGDALHQRCVLGSDRRRDRSWRTGHLLGIRSRY